MSYIGNTTVNQNYVPAVDYFNGDGSTVAFTLSRPVASVAAVQAVISNVPQNPGSAFTVSGSTITFTSAPPSGTANIYVYYTSPNTQVVQPGQGTVGTVQLADASVTAAKLASTTGTGAVSLASLPSFTTTIGVGGATASASGTGITFPATQSASSDANTLDDYEEGTFTPFMYGTTTAGTGTYSRQVGTYTKIGKSVSFTLIITWSAHTGTGNLRLGGMPFSTANTSNGYTTYSIQPSTLALIAGYYATAYQDPGGADMGIYQVATGGSSVSPVNMDTSAEVLISGIFLTA